MQTSKKPKGLAKIWREIKRPFRIDRWLDRKLRGMSKKDYKHFTYHLAWCNEVIIEKDGRVHIPNVEFYLAYECNLKCEFCALLNPFRTGIVAKEYLVDSFEKWSRKVSPGHVRLLGGEPLLNPDIAEIVTAASRLWAPAQIQVWTNAVLLPRVSDDILRTFQKCNVFMNISQHLDTDGYREILKKSTERLAKFGIQYHVEESFREWRKFIAINADGIPSPCCSDHKKSYERCHAKQCTTIEGDYIYRCSHLANMISAISEKSIGPEWNRVLTHKPMTLENSPEEIRNYLIGDAMKECSVCPEVRDIVEPRQLSLETIQSIKGHIQQLQKTA